MANKLEQSFRTICEAHDLASLSVTLLHADHCPEGWFNASAQREFNGQRICASGHSDSIAEAIGKAVAGLPRGNPQPVPLADEALPELAA